MKVVMAPTAPDDSGSDAKVTCNELMTMEQSSHPAIESTLNSSIWRGRQSGKPGLPQGYPTTAP